MRRCLGFRYWDWDLSILDGGLLRDIVRLTWVRYYLISLGFGVSNWTDCYYSLHCVYFALSPAFFGSLKQTSGVLFCCSCW